MSIVIKGMDMPTSCSRCPCSNDESRFCRAAEEYVPMLGKPAFCPLVDVPDTNVEDMISRQDAIDAFDGTKVNEEDCTEYDIGYNDGIDFAVSKLSVLPSAQPEGINYVKFSEEDYEKIAEQLRKIPIVLTLSEPEIIRCKDCKNFGGGTYCHEKDGLWNENDFCSYAERKEQDDG